MLTKLGPLVEWAFAGQVFYSSLIWTVTDTGFHKKKKHVRAVRMLVLVMYKFVAMLPVTLGFVT